MAGSILLAITGFDPSHWLESLERHLQGRRAVVLDGAAYQPAEISYAVVWKQRPAALENLPNLKAVFSIGAGVDHIFAGGHVPAVPIVRMVADDLTERMSEYVVWQVLDHHRKGALYRKQQAQKLWHEYRRQSAARNVVVGILGLGVLGTDAAIKLRHIGFDVAGWSRTPKLVDGVTCFDGRDGLATMLGMSDIVVCLLPLTAQTRGILSAELFDLCKPGSVLINAGRGGLQVEADIIAALDSGQLSAASLDVFQVEPLAAESPLWSHPHVTITPHAAATSDPAALIPPMVAQMDAHDRGEALTNLVDVSAGY